MKSVFLPGSTIGVLGSGQLGRMFALAARRMGYRVHTFSPESDTPTGQVADVEWTSSYDDLDQIRAFAQQVDVVTFEFENVPSAAIEAITSIKPVHPKPGVLHTTQQRVREKDFLKNNGFPVTPFYAIHETKDLESASTLTGFPAVLKTAGFGYDGKGQRMVHSPAELHRAFVDLSNQPCILEALVDFQQEMSVVVARNGLGEIRNYGIVENRHKNHILDITLAPFSLPNQLRQQAIEIAEGIVTKLDVVGVMCIEMFLTKKGKILVNELAPRPHNSGHFTIDACVTNQFEQQLRAVCGLPLGSTEQPRPAAMVNLLGDLWAAGEPNWAEALKAPDVKLHLYGKKKPITGRKMGHITVVADTLSEAEKRALHAREVLNQ